MGKVKYLLSKLKLKPESDRYNNLYSVERADDSFHIHWRNIRIESDKEEFELFTYIINIARQKWIDEGKPDLLENGILCYDTGNIKPIHGINPDILRIEWDELMGDAIHLHYKSIRLEFSIKEFLEFSNNINEARLELLYIMRQDD
jgi:hypothetical protein